MPVVRKFLIFSKKFLQKLPYKNFSLRYAPLWYITSYAAFFCASFDTKTSIAHDCMKKNWLKNTVFCDFEDVARKKHLLKITFLNSVGKITSDEKKKLSEMDAVQKRPFLITVPKKRTGNSCARLHACTSLCLLANFF